MDITSMPEKKTFIKGVKTGPGLWRSAWIRMRQGWPSLWKNYKALILVALLSGGIMEIFNYYLEEIEGDPYESIFLGGAIILYIITHMMTLSMIAVRVFQGSFAPEGYVPVGWQGIKWGMRETKWLWSLFLLLAGVIISSAIIGGFLYLVFVLINGFPLDFSRAVVFQSSYNLMIGGSLVLGWSYFIYCRLILVQILALANIKQPLREALRLTRERKAYTFKIGFPVVAVMLAWNKSPDLTEKVIKVAKVSSPIAIGIYAFAGEVIEYAIQVFFFYLLVEMFNRIATPEFRERVIEGCSFKPLNKKESV